MTRADGRLTARSHWHTIIREREPLIDAFVASVFCVVQDRSAWNGWPSSTYRRLGSYFVDLDSARAGVETRRVQGSQWRILEEPAFCLEGTHSSVLVVDYRGSDPIFAPLGRRTGLQAIADALDPGGATIGAISMTGLARFRPPARTYSSASWGGNYRLTFSETGTRESLGLEPILDLMKAAVLHLDGRASR
jgi:hypothetical protein